MIKESRNEKEKEKEREREEEIYDRIPGFTGAKR